MGVRVVRCDGLRAGTSRVPPGVERQPILACIVSRQVSLRRWNYNLHEAVQCRVPSSCSTRSSFPTQELARYI